MNIDFEAAVTPGEMARADTKEVTVPLERATAPLGHCPEITPRPVQPHVDGDMILRVGGAVPPRPSIFSDTGEDDSFSSSDSF